MGNLRMKTMLAFAVPLMCLGVSAGVAAQEKTIPAPGTEAGKAREATMMDVDGADLELAGGRLGKNGLDAGRYNEALNFFNCAVNRNADKAATLLIQVLPGRVDDPIKVGRYMNQYQGCAAANRNLPLVAFNGALAETLIKQGGNEVAPVSSMDQLQSFLRYVPIAEDMKKGPGAKAQLESQCRAAVDPVRAKAFVMSEVGSESEANAQRMLNLATPQCDALKPERDLGTLISRAYVSTGLFYWMDFSKRPA